MKKVFQTTFGKEGNCLCACLASILEIDIETIPNPKHDDWQNEMNDWLIRHHGVYMVTINADGYFSKAMKDGLIIGAGYSCTGLMHAVVCQNGKIIHDPMHNSNLTFDKLLAFDIICKYYE